MSDAVVGQDMCTGSAPGNPGGVVSLRPVVTGSTVTVHIGGIMLPDYGKIKLVDGSKIKLTDHPEGTEISSLPTAQWKDKAATKGEDFLCADNWVLAGTTTNPSFQVPCYTDTVHFDDV